MGAPEAAAGEETIVGINVTPLVDITLVLLIVFMVTAKLIVSQAVPFDLPKAATGGATQVVFTISVDGRGQVRADGHEMSDDESLQKAAARRAGARSRDSHGGAGVHRRRCTGRSSTCSTSCAKRACAASPSASTNRAWSRAGEHVESLALGGGGAVRPRRRSCRVRSHRSASRAPRHSPRGGACGIGGARAAPTRSAGARVGRRTARPHRACTDEGAAPESRP